MFGGTSELVLQYHSITIHIENSGVRDIDLSLLSPQELVFIKDIPLRDD